MYIANVVKSKYQINEVVLIYHIARFLYHQENILSALESKRY